MLVGPHHFQAQSRYLEDLICFTSAALWSAPCGFSSCEFDLQAVRAGTLSLRHIRCIFPDGLPFNAPDSDRLPPPKDFSESFSRTDESLTAYLAIGSRRAGCVRLPNASVNPNSNPRYIAVTEVFRDNGSPDDEKPVMVGEKNVRIAIEGETSDDDIFLPLCRMRREGSDRFGLDSRFIPPCLRIDASQSLQAMLGGLVRLMEDKAAAITGDDHGETRRSVRSVSADVTASWLLYLLNSQLARLRNEFISKRAHPQDIFRDLLLLAGGLCTFGIHSDPLKLPVYDHYHLGDCFAQLDRHIRAHLDVVVPPVYAIIPLQPTGEYLYSGEINDPMWLGPSKWILAIQANCARDHLVSKTQDLVKICSSDLISKQATRSLGGLKLVHLKECPPDIPPSGEAEYFQIEKSGPCWQAMVSTRSIGILVPADLPHPKLEVTVLLESVGGS